MKKEKQYLIFSENADGTKKYYFDFENGYMYGAKGNPLVTTPKIMRSVVNEIDENGTYRTNVYAYFVKWFLGCYKGERHEFYKNLGKIVEMANAHGLMIEDCDFYNAQGHYDLEGTKFIVENITLYREWLSIRHFCSFQNYVLLKKRNLNLGLSDEATYHLSRCINFDEYDNVQLGRIAKIFSPFYDLKDMIYYENLIRTFIKECKDLEIEIPKTNNPLRTITEVHKMYIAHKKEIEEKKKKEHLEKMNRYFYENDKYIIIIPKEEKEFIKESTQQNNCVYNCYYHGYMKGEYDIVFIRKKEEIDKSYVTCEIRNGKIIQYLTKNNRRIEDDFRAEYEKFLKTL